MFTPAALSDLDSALRELENIERERRELDAKRQFVLARVNEIVRKEVDADRAAGHIRSHEAAEETIAFRSARAEVATALHISEQTAARHLMHAYTVKTHYAATLASLSDGAISAQHVSVITEAASVLNPMLAGEPDENGHECRHECTCDRMVAVRAEYEARVLEYAVETTPGRLRPIARRIAEEYAATSLDERYAHERRFRAVWITDRENGMAELGAYLPAEIAYGIYSRLNRIAKKVDEAEAAAQTPQPANGDQAQLHANGRRTRNEVRTDILADLLLSGVVSSGGASSTETSSTEVSNAAGSGLQGIVQVIMHDGTLAVAPPTAPHASPAASRVPTLTPTPTLEGYGPIPHSSAREIAAATPVWNAVTTDPATGFATKVDRYRPSDAMRRYLIARDQHCRFPGCRVPAHRCDLDHTVDAARGGPTSIDNLGALCRGHHTLKHHGGWEVTQHDGGVYDWTSPTGRTHTDRPPGMADPPAIGRVSRVRFEAAA